MKFLGSSALLVAWMMMWGGTCSSHKMANRACGTDPSFACIPTTAHAPAVGTAAVVVGDGEALGAALQETMAELLGDGRAPSCVGHTQVLPLAGCDRAA